MASDFSVTWQCLSKRTIVFLLWIKLHAHQADHFVFIDIKNKTDLKRGRFGRRTAAAVVLSVRSSARS
jgi:hypothetical protein